VSVVDDRGNLLAKGQAESDDPSATSTSAEELRRAYEQRLARTIEGIIERTIGPGKVRAEVAVDLDFDRIVTNQELYDPDGQVVRSTQTVTETNEASENAAQVTVQNNLPDANTDSSAPKTTNRGNRSEETTNFEISKTIRQHTRESGVVRKLSVAVVVDGNVTGTGADKKYEPRSDEEMQRLTALVRSAIGYNATRGDSLEVVNMQFAEIQTEPEEDTTKVMGFERADLLDAAEVITVAIMIILVVLLVLQPMVGKLLATDGPKLDDIPDSELLPGMAANPALTGPNSGAFMNETFQTPELADEAESLIDVQKVEGRVKASSLKKVEDIVTAYPEETVSVLRNWMTQES